MERPEFKIRSTVSTKSVSLSHHHKVENHKLSYPMSGTTSITVKYCNNCVDFFAQLCANKFEKWDKLHNFLEKFNLSKLPPGKRVSLNTPSFYRRNRKNCPRTLSHQPHIKSSGLREVHRGILRNLLHKFPTLLDCSTAWKRGENI